MNNIPLPPTNWVPVGDSANPFTATLEGNNFTISNLKISSGTDRSNTGFIGVLEGSAGAVQNLNFAAGSVSSEYRGTTERKNNLGGVVGQIYRASTIDNVSSALSVSIINSRCYNVGGLVGESNGLLKDSSSTGNVDSTRSGGWCGGPHDSNSVGGLVGNSSRVESSYATGNVTGGNARSYIGGLVGVNHSTVDGSYATGSVTDRGESELGGLVGRNLGVISMSHTGDMVAGTKAGDVFGYDFSRIGGLVGYFDRGTISSSYATGDVYSIFAGNLGWEYHGLGGLIGMVKGDIVTDNYATGNVTGNKGNDKVGGLVGILLSCGALENK